MKFEVLIVDDEPLAREGIRDMLQNDPEIEIVGECANGRDAVVAIRKRVPDLVFLDVQMPLLDGFGVIDEIRDEHMPLVIFVTAYDEFALKAFEAHALDYLLKPVNDERLNTALLRAKKLMDRSDSTSYRKQLEGLLEDLRAERKEDKQKRYLDRVSFKSRDRIMFVDVPDIEWIEAADNYVDLHVGKQSHLVRHTLSYLESRLDPRRFVRIRHSTIVNVEKVKELRPTSGGEYDVVLQSGAVLETSRRYRKKLDALLNP